MKSKNAQPGDPTRKCWACQKTKPVEQFSKNKKGVDGYATLCLECKRIKGEKWRTGRPTYERERTLKKYGIDIATYEATLEIQGGCCRICKKRPEDDPQPFHVDHSHKTGRVRGILCHGCNTGIGLFKEDVAFLKEAIAYIERDQSWPMN